MWSLLSEFLSTSLAKKYGMLQMALSEVYTDFKNEDKNVLDHSLWNRYSRETLPASILHSFSNGSLSRSLILQIHSGGIVRVPWGQILRTNYHFSESCLEKDL